MTANLQQSQVLALLDQWCSHLLWKTNQHRVPIDLHALATSLGVTEVRRITMEAWGFVERTDGKTVICLRDGTPPTRERFSLAHEIGHVILQNILQPGISHDFKKFREQAKIAQRMDEERLADHIAASLLLPEWHIRPLLGDDPKIANIHLAAVRSQASLSAALLRTIWLATNSCVAFHVRQAGHASPRLVWQHGSPSVAGDLVRADLSDPIVLQAVMTQREVVAPGLNYAWLRCETISRNYQDIRSTYGFARIEPASHHSLF